MRVFGLKLWPNRPTDEEYIARLRKDIRVNRRIRYFHGLWGLGMLVLCIWGIDLIFRILSKPGLPSQQQSLVYLTFVVAAILGTTVGFWIARAVVHLASVFFEDRKDRLLIECWDTMNTLLEERGQASNDPVQERNGDGPRGSAGASPSRIETKPRT